MISLNLVLISRSVRSRSVGLSEESNRVTGRGNKLDSWHFVNGYCVDWILCRVSDTHTTFPKHVLSWKEFR